MKEIERFLNSPMQAAACALGTAAEATLAADGTASCKICGAHIPKYCAKWSVDKATWAMTGPLCYKCCK